MKFRVISDLHVDVNYKYPLTLNETSKDVATLIAGDISGSPDMDLLWLSENTNYHGYMVSGNHIVYNNLKKTIEDLQDMEREYFKNSSWKYLEKEYVVLEDEKIVIFGATLWTDYEVGFFNHTINMIKAKVFMNDFMLGKCKDENGEEVKLYPQWCREEHFKTLEILDKICNKYKDYSIIVLTHHCPSTKSISYRYSSSEANGAYVSNLDNFIIEHPNIKVWVCGHVHHRHSYNIGQCTILSNPRGYVKYGEDNGWTPDEFNFELKDGEVIMENNDV